MPERSRSVLQKLIEALSPSMERVKQNYRTRVGDAILARIPPLRPAPKAEAIPLEVVFEDDSCW